MVTRPIGDRGKVSETLTKLQAALEPLDDATILETLRQATEEYLDRMHHSVPKEMFIRNQLKSLARRL